MRRIVLLTSLYPTLDKDYTVTPVCHYFVKEWKRAGHDVRVVNITSRYFGIINVLAKPVLSIIKAKTGFSIYTNSPKISNTYIYEGVEVLNIPVKKLYPHQYPSLDKCKEIAYEIKRYLDNGNFIPDIITGHIINPSLGIINYLKQFYSCKTCLVSHGYVDDVKKFPLKDPLSIVDVWGFRSSVHYRRFIEEYGGKYKGFVCHSGIPEKYIEKFPKHYRTPIENFCFLGSLFKLKKVDVLIKAFGRINNPNVKLNIIGGGAEYKKLLSLTKSLHIEKIIKFWGKQQRDNAQEIMRNTDCYVMISKEAFGLVYIEAMAKGLVTVGLKNSGIDGVIRDGVNGFLCQDQTEESLVELLNKILSLSIEDLNIISENAWKTATEMTDFKMATEYIKNIENAEKMNSKPADVL